MERPEDDMSGEIVPPNPSRLIESIRGFGYSLPWALADLIDNSLTAAATNVAVEIDLLAEVPHVAVIDDGCGMSKADLVEAMRMGAMCERASVPGVDLGRFGLGLKSASLSQGKSLTVISRTATCATPSIRRWSLDHVAQTGTWELLTTPGTMAAAYLTRFADTGCHGTAVIIEDLDRLGLSEAAADSQARHSGVLLERVRQHLEMTFHRFITDRGIVLRLGTSTLSPWDPFLRQHSDLQPIERFQSGDAAVIVQPFLLPHHSRVDADVYERAAGPNGWLRHQGFYIYRCGRLIVPGSWLGLGFRQTDQTRLARIRVDLPNTIDDMWQLNVMKSRVTVPPAMRDDFRRIADDLCRSARRVYGYRGERSAPAPESPRRSVWRRRAVRGSVAYSVDRTHPVVAAILSSQHSDPRIVEQALRVIERAIPVAAILQESQASLDGAAADINDDDVQVLSELADFSIQHYVRCGLSRTEARERVLSSSPFCDYRSLIDEHGE